MPASMEIVRRASSSSKAGAGASLSLMLPPPPTTTPLLALARGEASPLLEEPGALAGRTMPLRTPPSFLSESALRPPVRREELSAPAAVVAGLEVRREAIPLRRVPVDLLV